MQTSELEQRQHAILPPPNHAACGCCTARKSEPHQDQGPYEEALALVHDDRPD